jgi:carbamoyl-phosphate synthase large subunit
MKNILITAIGSMSFEGVIKTLKSYGVSKIVGCDINDSEYLYPSKQVDTFYKVSKALNPKDYINDLLNICSKENIDFILPLTDLEIDVINQNRDLFKNITLGISDFDTINLCRNKKLVYDKFKNNKIVKTIPTFQINEIKEVNNLLLAKPINGRSSEHLFKINTNNDLHYLQTNDFYKNHIIQPILQGTIITVDIVKNQNGKIIFLPRKELLRTSNGAGIAVEVYSDKQLTSIITAITSELNIIGAISIEFIYNNENYYLMDINPRFSAGISFSQLAGFDPVINHLNCFYNNEFILKENIKYGFYNKRYLDYEL